MPKCVPAWVFLYLFHDSCINFPFFFFRARILMLFERYTPLFFSNLVTSQSANELFMYSVLSCMLLSFSVALLHEWANSNRTGHGLGHSQNPWRIQTLHWLPRQERTHTLSGFCKEILACLANVAICVVHWALCTTFWEVSTHCAAFAYPIAHLAHLSVPYVWKHNAPTPIACWSVSYVHIRDNKETGGNAS